MEISKVFVIIITYNGFKWVDKCFSSLKKSIIPVQIIVIDNGSVDGTIDQIKIVNPEAIVYKLEKNQGFGYANNIGIKIAYDAGADFVFLLNQDAWIEPNTISDLIKHQKKMPEYGIVSPMHLTGDGLEIDYYFSNYIIPTRCPNLFSNIYLQKNINDIYPVESVNAAAWLICRNCIKKIGGFSPLFFHYGEDDNYIDRLHYYNLKIGILPSVVIYHDREKRVNNRFFINENVVLNRLLMVEYANPILNKKLFASKMFFLKSAILSIIKGNISESKKLWGKFKTLHINMKSIQKHRTESMSGKDLCFLDKLDYKRLVS